MTENYYAIAGLFEAIKKKFGQGTGETPVKCIIPAEFREVCTAYGIDNGTAYDLATFAVSLVSGMLKAPDTVTAIVGGSEGGTLGGELIVQTEDLTSLILESFSNTMDAKISVVNLATGKTISEKTVTVKLKE